MTSTDRDVLIALFGWNGGTSWRRKGNWGTVAKLADWEGVEVDAHGRVVGLSLPKNKLQGEIPKRLGAFKAMQKLDLSFNFLTGSIPDELGALTSMKILDLSNNYLEGSIPDELGALTSMKILDLSNNYLEGSISKELAALTDMQLLNLGMNKLTGSIPGELSALPKMQELYLSFNKLTGEGVSSEASGIVCVVNPMVDPRCGLPVFPVMGSGIRLVDGILQLLLCVLSCPVAVDGSVGGDTVPVQNDQSRVACLGAVGQ